MSIIRSNIARQLLAEGGAPRKPFANGGFDYESAAAFGNDMGMTSTPSSTDYSSFGPDQEEDNARMMSDMGLTPSVGPDRDDDDKALSYVNFNRPTEKPSIFSVDNFNPFPILTGGMRLADRGLRNLFKTDRYNLARRTDFLRKQGLIGPGEEDEKYTDEFLLSPEGLDMLRGMGYTTIQDVINKGEGGDSEPIKKLRAPITEKIEKEKPKDEFEEIRKFYSAKFEDGGEVRQKYGLGSLVKKATGALKKIVKSPIGKAAILGFGAYKLGEGSGLIKSFKALDPIKQALILGGGALTAAPFFMGQDEEEEKLPTQDQSDPAFRSYLAYYGGPTRFAADGGDIDEAPTKMASKPSSFAELNMLSLDLFGRPYDQLNDSEQEILMEYFSKGKDMPERTMAAEGGMMNLGGNEMDLRGGGFVPIGAREKADDVPARLSKNEFVFTADAVRAAGGGSVDRGADLMYKTMKQLENKVV